MSTTMANAQGKGGTARQAGKPAPKTPEERIREKRERFLRLAPQRVQKALDRIRQVSNLGVRANYTYTAEEAAKVIAALQAAVRDVQTAFSGAAAEKPTFTL